MTTGTLLIIAGAAVVAVLVVDYLLRVTLWSRRLAQARTRAERVLEEAASEAESVAREAEIRGQEKADQVEAESLAHEQERREKLDMLDAELRKRRSEVDRDIAGLHRRAETVERREKDIVRREAETVAREEESRLRESELQSALETVAEMSRDEARDRLARQMVEQAREAAEEEIRRVTSEARTTLDDRLKEMMTRSVQRIPASGAVESTVSVIRLPSDDMKGRIIGREGRNIRSIEMVTGIDLIVDDTPQAILVSCFDPMRREIARIAIERLVEDGRIHPARIEELVEKTREEMDRVLYETADAAIYELGLQDIDEKLFPMLGRLKYHTVTGQNLLQHSRETADLAGAMAAELGLPVDVPRRAGLLHEIAQASEDRLTAPSIIASADIAGRHGESKEVQHAIAASHQDVAPRRVEAALVRLACRLSRSRPGARKHNLETFISRMRRLEKVAAGMQGVVAAHAFRAGKELRVVVESSAISDEEASLMCKELAGRIEKEVEHTGQLRVTVLRETRSVDYAL